MIGVNDASRSTERRVVEGFLEDGRLGRSLEHGQVFDDRQRHGGVRRFGVFGWFGLGRHRVRIVGLVVGLLGTLDDLLGARGAQTCEQIVDGAGRTVDRFRFVVVVGPEQCNDRRRLARVLELVVSVHLVGVTHQQHGVVGLFDGCNRLLGLDLLLGLVASR